MDRQPSNPDWWRKQIERESKARRTRYFPCSGRLIAVVVSLIVAPPLTFIAAGRLGAQQYSRIAWAVLMLLGLIGINLRWFLSLLKDPYHTRFYHTSLELIGENAGEYEMELKGIADEHLEPFTDSEEKEKAQKALEKCAEELADRYVLLKESEE